MRGRWNSVWLILAIMAENGSLPAWQGPAAQESAAKAEEARGAARYPEAEALYREALAADSQWAEGWWRLGTLLYDQDRCETAVPAFERAVALQPRGGTAIAMLGLCESRLGRVEEALRHIRQGRDAGADPDPQFQRVMTYTEGMLQLQRGDFDGAQKTLGALSKAGASGEDLLLGLGMGALRIRPANLPGDDTGRRMVLHAGMAENAIAQERLDDAAKEYERFIGEYEAARNAQYAWGRFLLLRNREEEALGAFRKEIANSPQHLLARLALAEVGLQMDAPDARRYAEEAVALAPQIPFARYLLGEILLKHGEVKRATVELEGARQALPAESRIHWALARAYAQAGREEDASRARAEVARLKAAAEAARGGGRGTQ